MGSHYFAVSIRYWKRTATIGIKPYASGKSTIDYAWPKFLEVHFYEAVDDSIQEPMCGLSANIWLLHIISKPQIKHVLWWHDSAIDHDDVIKWKHFPRYWPFLRGIHRPPENSPHKGQWRRTLFFFFDLRLNKRLSKQSWGWWFETPSRPLWRQCNDNLTLRRHRIQLIGE